MAVRLPVVQDGAGQFQQLQATDSLGGEKWDWDYMLTANQSAVGAGIADFFPASSSFSTATNGIYEIVYSVYFTKTTAGTVTWTVTNTQAYTNFVGMIFTSPSAGIASSGTAGALGLVANTTAAAAFPATASLTTAVNHHAFIRCIAECGTAGNIRLRVTSSAGTVTPLRGSRYAAQVIAPNIGTFVA